jgi:hypothetical protein
VAYRATLLNRSISNATVSAITALLDIIATAILRMAHDSVRSRSLRHLGARVASKNSRIAGCDRVRLLLASRHLSVNCGTFTFHNSLRLRSMLACGNAHHRSARKRNCISPLTGSH